MDASQPSLPDDDWLRHIETILNSSNYRSLSIDDPFKFLDHDIHAKFTTDTAPFTAENIYSQSNLNNTIEMAADTTARLTLASLMNAADTAPSTAESIYSQSNLNNATKMAADTTAGLTLAPLVNAADTAPSTAESIYSQSNLNNATKMAADTTAGLTLAPLVNAADTAAPSTAESIYSQSNLNNATKMAADTTAGLTLASLMNAVESSYSQSNPNNATKVAMDTTKPTAPSTAETTNPQFSLSNTSNNVNTTQSAIQSWINAANTALSTVETTNPQFSLSNTSNNVNTTQSAIQSWVDAANTALSTVETTNPQFSLSNTSNNVNTTQSAIQSWIDAANTALSTAETTNPQFSLSNTPNNANTTQSNIQSWVDAANAALSTVETSHLNDNTPDTTEPATSAPESTSLSTINTIHPQIQTNGIGPATSATQSIRHSLNSTNLSQMTHLISSKTSITVHIYLASSWIEIPSLHSIFWNINVPSTWISVQGESFAISPIHLLEILQDYQTYIAPPSLLPESIYLAACNPTSMLLTSSLVTIDSPLGSPHAQGRIIGKVGNVLNFSPTLIMGIDENDPLNWTFFNMSAKLNLLGSSTGKHFVLVFLPPPQPSGSSPAPLGSRKRWSPYGPRPIPSSIPSTLSQMYQVSSESHMPFSPSQPELCPSPSPLHPRPSSSPLQLPHPTSSPLQLPRPLSSSLQSPHPLSSSLQSPHPLSSSLQSSRPTSSPLQSPRPSSSNSSCSALFSSSPRSSASSGIATSLSPSPQPSSPSHSSFLLPPLQPLSLRPSPYPPLPRITTSSEFLGIQNGDTFETNAPDLAHLCRGLGWELKALQYTAASTNADIVGLYRQYITGRTFEQKIGSNSKGDGDRRKRFVKYADNTVESVASILQRLKFKKSTYDDKRRLFSFVEDVGKSNKIWNPAHVPQGGFQKTFLRPYDVWVCIKYLWGPSGPLTLNKPLPEPSENEDPVIEASRKLPQGSIRQYRIMIENSLVDPM